MTKGEERFLSALEIAVDGAAEAAASAAAEMAGDSFDEDAFARRARAEVALSVIGGAVSALFDPRDGVGQAAAEQVATAIGRVREADAASDFLVMASLPDGEGTSVVLVFENGLPGLVRWVGRVPYEGGAAVDEAVLRARRIGLRALGDVMPGFIRTDTRTVPFTQVPKDAPLMVDLAVSSVPIAAAAPFSSDLSAIEDRYERSRSVLDEGDRRTLRRYESAVAAMAASVAAEMDLARRERSLSSNNPTEGVYREWSVIQSAAAALRRAAASAYLDALPQMVAERGSSDELIGAVRDMAMVNLGELQAQDAADGWNVVDMRDVDGNLLAVDVTHEGDGSHVRYAVGGRPRGIEWTFWNYQRALSEVASMGAPVSGAVVGDASTEAADEVPEEASEEVPEGVSAEA